VSFVGGIVIFSHHQKVTTQQLPIYFYRDVKVAETDKIGMSDDSAKTVSAKGAYPIRQNCRIVT
jgi:hypothetical protein